MSIQSLCSRHTVTVKTKTATPGAAGSSAYTYPGAGTDVRCWVQPLGARESLELFQRGSNATHRVYFASDPSIKNGDQLTFGTRTFYADGDSSNSCEMDRLWSVLAIESDHG